MGDILKEILKRLPEDKISEATFEGANIVLYTKDREYSLDNKGTIRQVVDELKKRIELRPDPAITVKPEKAEEIIKKLLPEECGAKEFIFDQPRSRVIIHVEKPGVAIGKQGSVLKDIRAQTYWVPIIRRIPPLRSKLIEGIRAVLYKNADERKKFLDKVGHRVYDGWLREKKQEWVRLTFLGGARQVGRSCIFLQTPESRILLDCGIDPSTDTDSYPFLDAPEFDIKELDAVVISHSHLDHSGLIPYLFKFGYTGPIYCTAPTRDTMVLLQLDYVKIQRSEGREPIYTSEEVTQMVLHTICLDPDEVTDITPDLRLTFYNAGHILGSTMVHLNIGNGLHNLLYTGDLKFARTNLFEPAHTSFPRLETVIIESTYGGRDNVMSEQQADEYMANVIIETVKRRGKILIPVLGSGRAQEIMVMVEDLIQSKRIEPIKVYADGLLWDITAIHTAYPEYLNRNMRQLIFHENKNPFLSETFQRVVSQKERKQIIEEEGPCVILATSGMLYGGPSVEYLKGLAEDKRHSLVFSCYQPPSSLGRRILSGEKEIMFSDAGKNHMLHINLEVHRVEISGHSDRNQLMNFIKRCMPMPKKVIVNHGESSRCLDLASSIHHAFNIETVAPKNLEAVRIR